MIGPKRWVWHKKTPAAGTKSDIFGCFGRILPGGDQGLKGFLIAGKFDENRLNLRKNDFLDGFYLFTGEVYLIVAYLPIITEKYSRFFVEMADTYSYDAQKHIEASQRKRPEVLRKES
ncbi:MAG: hypothetical protein DRP56_03140 [Planctomycetota bacterium]|nr:MAG: hypothetical protein DRP56_03140 [Planctomycetota bacterium]